MSDRPVKKSAQGSELVSWLKIVVSTAAAVFALLSLVPAPAGADGAVAKGVADIVKPAAAPVERAVVVDPADQPDTSEVVVPLVSSDVTIVGDSLANQIAAFSGFDNQGHNFCGYTQWDLIQWPGVHDTEHDACTIPWESVTGRSGVVLMSLSTHDMVLRGDTADNMLFRFDAALYVGIDAEMKRLNPDAAVVWYANFLAPSADYAEREAANIAAVESLGLSIISDAEMMNEGTWRYDGSHYDGDSAALVGARLLAAANGVG